MDPPRCGAQPVCNNKGVLPALLFDVWAVLVLMTPKPPKGTSWRWQGGRSWAERPQRAGSSAG